MRRFSIICSAILGASLLTFPAIAQQKTVKACTEEWRANKADNQAKGITEKTYVAQCRGQSAAKPAAAEKKAATPAPAPAPAPAPTAAAPAKPAPAATGAMGSYQYSTETQAKMRCGTGTVVWANTNSKIYHFAGHKDYGHTKTGAYMCEQDATSQGIRAAKNEKHP